MITLSLCMIIKDEELVLQLIEKFPQINFNPKSRVGTPILHRLAYQGALIIYLKYYLMRM